MGQAGADMMNHPWISIGMDEPIRVALVMQHSTTWTSFRSIWEVASHHRKLQIEVILCPFLHPFSNVDQIAHDMSETAACLKKDDVPFVEAEDYNPQKSRPHVIFIPNPYEETRPKHLRTQYLRDLGIRPAYIPYGLEMGGGEWNINAQFNETIQNKAWRIFARSERHKSMFGKYCGSGNSHVVVTGHPKFDSRHGHEKQAKQSELVEKAAGRRVVLWTPHFTAGGDPEWSTFDQYGPFIMSEIACRPELFLIIRPHPLFFSNLRYKGAWTSAHEDAFRKTIAKSANMTLDESPDYYKSFSASDALMADVGSFLLEYLPTGKPLLYLHLLNGIGLNDDGSDLVKHLYRADSHKDIADFLNMITHNEDPHKSIREKITPEFLAALDCNIGRSICREIRKACLPVGAFLKVSSRVQRVP